MLTLSTFLLENTNTCERLNGRSLIAILQYKLIDTFYFGFKE